MCYKVVRVVRDSKSKIVERVEMIVEGAEGVVGVEFYKKKGRLKTKKYFRIRYASPCPRPFSSGWDDERPLIDDEVFQEMKKQACGIFFQKRGRGGEQLLLPFEGL